MTIAGWMWPVLAREADWPAALARLVADLRGQSKMKHTPRAAVEVAEACEHIDPERRHAIEAYALAGVEGAARGYEVSVELAWWSAAGRFAALAGDAPREAEAWFDAGEDALAALALSVLPGDALGASTRELAELLDGKDIAAPRVKLTTARIARTRGRPEGARAALEEVLASEPGNAIAAAQLLALAVADPDPAHVHRYLKLRLAGLAPAAWIDAMRGCAIAVASTDRHRGFGQRLLRFTLERAYELRAERVPGHLAMWNVLAARAAADGARRELLQLAVQALDVVKEPEDRVWIAALAAEISLIEGRSPVVAGQYAEIVAEHAPEHPTVRQLVMAVASARPSMVVPAAAVAAAHELADAGGFDIDVDLDDAYAAATEAAVLEEDEERGVDGGALAQIVAAANTEAKSAPAQLLAPVNGPGGPPPVPASARASTPPNLSHAGTPPSVPRVGTPPSLPRIGTPPDAPPLPSLPRTTTLSQPRPEPEPPVVAPVRPPIAPPRFAVSPAVPVVPKHVQTQPMPSLMPRIPVPKKIEPVLAALRAIDRPTVPPRPADPPDALMRARRTSIAIDLRLELPDGTRVDAHSRDVSSTGLFVLTDAALGIGTTLRATLMLPGKEAFTEDAYDTELRVVRRAPGGFGVVLIEPAPALVTALEELS